MQDNEDKKTSADEVQSTREYKEIPSVASMSVCFGGCVLSAVSHPQESYRVW